MNKKRVIIIGAGIGGLTAGALLTKKGYTVTIFEKESMIGGRALTFEGSLLKIKDYIDLLNRFNMNIVFSEPNLENIFLNKMLDGYKLDLGYHAIGGGISSNTNSVLSEISEHVDFLESRVGLINENRYSFPFLKKKDIVKILPIILRLLFASEKTLKKLDKVSMTETINNYGKGNMRLILEIFSRSISTMNNLDLISTGEMIRAQKNLFKGSKPVGYPKGGLLSITKKLADYIIKNGGYINLNNKVDKVLIKNNKVEGVIVNNKKVLSEVVISNILVQNLFNIADEKYFEKDYVNYIKLLPGTGSLCAYYSFKKLNPDLIGKNFHFIERNAKIEGKDAVGMIDFMSASPDSGLSPDLEFLVQSYIICTPKEAKDQKNLERLKQILDKNLEILIPEYKKQLNWAIYPVIWHLDGVAKTIDMDKPSIKTPVKNLFLVGDCVKAPGIGFNCALNSGRILSEMI